MATANFKELVAGMRQVFMSGRTKSMDWRHKQLELMLKMFDENRDKLCDALKQDLNKSKFESLIAEVDFCRNDLILCMNNLNDWVKPEKVKKGLINIMDKCYIRKEPYGVTLIMSAWNYPVQLIFLPMIGAIAAGNCCVLKPSEISWNTAVLIEELVPKYFDTDCIKVVNGGIPETTALLKEQWDYIFYTGNSMVGKIVMKAAAEYLTPITLELGGKSPVYIDKDVDLSIVANRLIWAKTMNAGQTCIAPDYVMCSKDTQDRLIEKIKSTLGEFYPDGPAKSPDYPRLVSDRHFQKLVPACTGVHNMTSRFQAMTSKSKGVGVMTSWFRKRVKKLLDSANNVALGGDSNEQDRFIAPTVLSDVTFKDSVMQEEIFGPVLPVIPVAGEDEAIAHINEGTKPLAMYLYSNDHQLTEKFMNSCTSGSCCVNDCIMQGSVPTLPFGGVGTSGMGAYHGKFSYDTFCHKRAVMERGLKMESVNRIRYPPFSEKKINIIGKLMRKKVKKTGVTSYVPYFLVGTLIAVLLKMFLGWYPNTLSTITGK